MSLINVTFTGNPKFSAPRSYWRGIAIGYGPAATVTRSADVIHAHFNYTGGYFDSYVTLDPKFTPWSSHAWTLDRLFIDQVSFDTGNPTPLYLAANAGYASNPADGKFYAVMAYVGGSNYYFIPLEPAPSTYWLPEIP